MNNETMILNNKLVKYRNLIHDSLTNLIENDYILLDLPYHNNIGDILIWKGEETYLRSLKYTCLYRCSADTYQKPNIDSNVVILLHGGGNFGSVWGTHSEFRLKVINDFPDNKIIILPQTVFYESQQVMANEAMLMSKHQDLTICARDRTSFEILSKYFYLNNIITLPDMAFCIDPKFIAKYTREPKEKVLLFKRNDIEKAEYDFNKCISERNVDTKEWPSMDKKLFATFVLMILSILRKRLPRISFFKRLTDWYALNIYMPYLLRMGIRFLSGYIKVYSTRLHGAILAILLHKKVTFFDNSYGKNSSFYDSWLTGLGNVTFIYKEAKK